MLTEGSLTLKYKTYTMKSLDDALEAWKEFILNVEFGIYVVEKNKKGTLYLFLGHLLERERSRRRRVKRFNYA